VRRVSGVRGRRAGRRIAALLEVSRTFAVRQVIQGVHIVIFWVLTRCNVQGGRKVSVHLMITVQKHAKIFLNSFNHLP
jgi:Tfp pilus assembly protein FimT